MLKGMEKLLKISEKKSLISYIYITLNDLNISRNHFIDIYKSLFHKISSIDRESREIIYEILYAILTRSEIQDMSLLGFKSEKIYSHCNYFIIFSTIWFRL